MHSLTFLFLMLMQIVQITCKTKVNGLHDAPLLLDSRAVAAMSGSVMPATVHYYSRYEFEAGLARTKSNNELGSRLVSVILDHPSSAQLIRDILLHKKRTNGINGYQQSSFQPGKM